MTVAAALEQGRSSFATRKWREAYESLSAADRVAPLEGEDLERLATAAYLVGNDAVCEDTLVRAHNEFLQQGDTERAVRNAFWIGFALLGRGEDARGSGWISRARRLLDAERSCVEQGYLRVPDAVHALFSGNADVALRTFEETAAIGERFSDINLLTLSRMGQGQSLVSLGKTAAGVALFDEVMVAVTTGEVSPMIAGLAYCAIIETCSEIFDLKRAHEWTTALSQWCAAQPDMIPYRGQCLVRRAEILQLHGAWGDAMQEAERARDTLSRRGERAVGAALYQLAELLRLRGEFAESEECYRLASQSGRKPHPGLALLRLAQGQVDSAKAAIARVLDESKSTHARSSVLAAYVDIMLRAGEVGAARAAATELAGIASDFDSQYLQAVAARAEGAVLLAEDDPRAAVTALRRAFALWERFEAPYETAQTTLLMALACRALGDHDSADVELEAAQRAFESLGATPAARRVAELRAKTEARPSGALTAREVEVLRLVAAGKTNRAVADELGISEKTIARHISNIFTKLGLSSRAAATAYAYKQGLV